MPVWLIILGALLTLQKRIYFIKTFLFVGRISLFSARTGFPFRCILHARDSSEYLGTSLFPFLAPEKGMTRMYIRTRNIS